MINSENDFGLKDNSSKPYAWILESVDICDLDSATEYVETYARTMINAENYNDISDSDMYTTWKLDSGEYEEAIAFVQEQMDAYISEHLTTLGNPGIKYQDDYQPECPICGMKPTANDDFGPDVHYACGHFIEVFNPWADGSTDADRWGYAKISSHVVVTRHELGGTNEWFFDAKSEQLNAVMTSTEIAERYGIDDSTIRQAVRRGNLRARKSGNVLLVLRTDAEERWSKHLPTLVFALWLAGCMVGIGL